MSLEEFTSVQWDRDEVTRNTGTTATEETHPIAEETESASNHSGHATNDDKKPESIHETHTKETDSEAHDQSIDEPVPEYTPAEPQAEIVEKEEKHSHDHQYSQAESSQSKDQKGEGTLNSDPHNPLLTVKHSESDHPPQEEPGTAKQDASEIGNIHEVQPETTLHKASAEPVIETSTLKSLALDAIDTEALKYTIQSSVTSPIRDIDTSSKPYISYLLTSTTDHPAVLKLTTHKKDDQEKTTITVRRRYGDFRILHDCLNNDYPTLLIPPLPSKSSFKYLTGDTFSTEFVHKRLHSLDRFIKFILQHKYLSQSSIFHLFLSDSNDWTTFTKNLKINYKDEDNGANGTGSGFVNKVVNEDLITETVMNFLTPSKHKRETNKEILEINDKLKKLYENLVRLDKIFVKLNKKNNDLSIDYEQFSNQILKLSIVQQVDPTGSEPTTPNRGTSIEDENSILNNFKIFSTSLDFFSKNWSELHHFIDESFLVTLKDSSKYIASLTSLIELQHNKKIDLQVLQDYLSKSRTELASLGAGSSDTSHHHAHAPPNPVLNASSSGGIVNNTTQLIKDTLSTSATTHIGSSVTDQKIQKLQQRTAQLENEIALQTKLVNDLTNKIITEEYPNWDKFNRNELKDSMLGLCDQEIKFYKGLVNNWSDVESKLIQRLDDLN